MKNKKGFTLVELLAVIVILAIILVIAVPKILTVIDDTRIESMKSSALMIIDSAEREYATRTALGQSTTGIACTDVASVSATDFILPVDATKECQITYNTTTGAATLRLYGKAGGKFAGKCITAGTRGSITVNTSGC